MKSNRRFQAFSRYDSDGSLLNFKNYNYTAEYWKLIDGQTGVITAWRQVGEVAQLVEYLTEDSGAWVQIYVLIVCHHFSKPDKIVIHMYKFVLFTNLYIIYYFLKMQGVFSCNS